MGKGGVWVLRWVCNSCFKIQLIREGSFKKNAHICPSGRTGGGGSAKIPTSLTDLVCVRNELFELQNKVSIQNMLCFLFWVNSHNHSWSWTCSTLAWLFTQQMPRLIWPLGPMRTGHINCSVPKWNISTLLEGQKINLLREGQAGGGGKATWPWGPNMCFFLFVFNEPSLIVI